MEDVTKRYNGLMSALGYEHSQIGTRYSEDTDGWNLRDMVAECDYILSTYYEEGSSNGEMREFEPKLWRSHVGKLERFIKRYQEEALKLKCKDKHCSRYD